MGPSVPTDFDPVKRFAEGLPKTGGYDEFGRRTSVVWNERDRKFQMIYRACGESYTGYAESEDGIRWTKPLVSSDDSNNPEIRSCNHFKDYPTYFEWFTLWKANFGEVGFPACKALKIMGLSVKLRISG